MHCMSLMLRILQPSSFFCHDPVKYLCGHGVCERVWTGKAFPPCRSLKYQSQKAVGRLKRVDTAGGFWGGGGWLLFWPLHQDPLKRSPSRPICLGSELSPLIGYGGQADVGAAAGGSDDSSSSLSHRRTVTQHQQLSNATCWSRGPQAHYTPLAWVTLKDRQTLFTSSSMHQRWTLMLHPELCLLLKFIMGVNWPCMNPLQGAMTN